MYRTLLDVLPLFLGFLGSIGLFLPVVLAVFGVGSPDQLLVSVGLGGVAVMAAMILDDIDL